MKTLGKISYYWPAFVLLAVIFVIWESAIRIGWISPIYLAAPSKIAEAFWDFFYTGEIWEHAYISILRFAIGLALGAAIGIAVGFLTGWFEPVRRTFEPIINALYGIPKIAILPMLILLLGIGEASKVMVIVITAFFSLWINTHTGLQNVDPLHIRVARDYGANELQVLLKVAFPTIIPYIAAGFRLGAGHSLIMVIAAEYLAAKNGLGYLISEAGDSYQLERLLSLIFLFGIIGFGMLRTTTFIERKVAPWKQEAGSG